MAIAVKVLREAPEAKEVEFKREVALLRYEFSENFLSHILRNLRHPHVVNFFGTIEEENKLCIVMELCGKVRISFYGKF
jgi:serine/threonine protein kinase